MSRVACSVDARTGDLRLHMRKNRKNNLRGTKYSIPAPNPTKGRFEGDLLLREDQLFTGIWAQKVRRTVESQALKASRLLLRRRVAYVHGSTQVPTTRRWGRSWSQGVSGFETGVIGGIDDSSVWIAAGFEVFALPSHRLPCAVASMSGEHLEVG